MCESNFSPVTLRTLLLVLLSIVAVTETVYVYGEPKYKCPDKWVKMLLTQIILYIIYSL